MSADVTAAVCIDRMSIAAKSADNRTVEFRFLRTHRVETNIPPSTRSDGRLSLTKRVQAEVKTYRFRQGE